MSCKPDLKTQTSSLWVYKKAFEALKKTHADYIKQTKKSIFYKPSHARKKTIAEVNKVIKHIQSNNKLSPSEKLNIMIGCIEETRNKTFEHQEKHNSLFKKKNSRLVESYDRWLEKMAEESYGKGINISDCHKQYENYMNLEREEVFAADSHGIVI